MQEKNKPTTEAPTEPTPFERFERLARKVVNTPKSVVEKDKKARQDQRAKASTRRKA